MPPQATNVRRAAVSALRAWEKGHTYMDSLIERHATRNNLSRQDRALLQSILSSVLRNRRLLDHWIAKLRKGKLDHETRDILRVGISQLLLLGIADHAAVNETVNCGKASVRGLINAVLRQAISRRDDLLGAVDELPPAVRYSHPDWLFKRWRRTFGKNNAIELMVWNNQPADTIGRANSLKPEALACIAGHERATAIDGLEGYFKIDGPLPKEWMSDGLLYVQDPATRHCVDLLQPQAGECILDACAAPGGKSSLIAARMNNQGEILCTDSNEKRLPRLDSNLSNQGIEITTVAQHDWSEKAPDAWLEKFDAILLDVPCSNSGVMRRRLDARWRLRGEHIVELNDIQEAILKNALPCLKPGGRLVYSTCSIEQEENHGLISRFVAQNKAWKLDAEHQALPFHDNSDGAYAARIIQSQPSDKG